MLLVNFAMSPGNFGPTLEAAIPGMVVGIQSIGIQRETPGTPAPTGLVVDAAEVNPAPTGGRGAKHKKA